MATVTVCDETSGGKITHELVIDVLTERITVRELIRSRVYQEVQDYNRAQPVVFRGLVQPTDAELTLNGFRLPTRRQIDWQEQFDSALEAFRSLRILVLVNDRQLIDLDDEIEVRPDSRINFLKLTPLVGG